MLGYHKSVNNINRNHTSHTNAGLLMRQIPENHMIPIRADSLIDIHAVVKSAISITTTLGHKKVR